MQLPPPRSDLPIIASLSVHIPTTTPLSRFRCLSDHVSLSLMPCPLLLCVRYFCIPWSLSLIVLYKAPCSRYRINSPSPLRSGLPSSLRLRFAKSPSPSLTLRYLIFPCSAVTYRLRSRSAIFAILGLALVSLHYPRPRPRLSSLYSPSSSSLRYHPSSPCYISSLFITPPPPILATQCGPC